MAKNDTESGSWCEFLERLADEASGDSAGELSESKASDNRSESLDNLADEILKDRIDDLTEGLFRGYSKKFAENIIKDIIYGLFEDLSDDNLHDLLKELFKVKERKMNMINETKDERLQRYARGLFRDSKRNIREFLLDSDGYEDLAARIEALDGFLEALKNTAHKHMKYVERLKESEVREVSEEEKKEIVDKGVLELVERFADAAQNILPYSRIYLFGSHVKGLANKHSDIDVAVMVDEIPGVREDYRVLEKPYFALNELSCYFYPIEPHLVQALHCQSGFAQTILMTGILMREPRVEQGS